VQTSPYVFETLAQLRVDDFRRDAEANRLAAQVTREGRSRRARLADGLYALAARAEGQPRRPANSGAPLAA
jgi:hypothetical protein